MCKDNMNWRKINYNISYNMNILYYSLWWGKQSVLPNTLNRLPKIMYFTFHVNLWKAVNLRNIYIENFKYNFRFMSMLTVIIHGSLHSNNDNVCLLLKILNWFPLPKSLLISILTFPCYLQVTFQMSPD